jgi:hypothetical protein
MEIDERDVRELLAVPEDTPDAAEARVARSMKRVYSGIGQRDALLFAIVRVWLTLATLLAPIFATAVRKKAQIEAQNRPPA